MISPTAVKLVHFSFDAIRRHLQGLSQAGRGPVRDLVQGLPISDKLKKALSKVFVTQPAESESESFSV